MTILSGMHPSVSGTPCVITSTMDIVMRYTIDTGINNSEYITIKTYITTVKNSLKIDIPEPIVLPAIYAVVYSCIHIVHCGICRIYKSVSVVLSTYSIDNAAYNDAYASATYNIRQTAYSIERFF